MIDKIIYKINELKKDRVVIVIDGRAGAGKTTLARSLCARLDANLIHTDDFFLPFELRTKERLAEPGGNVHYERFKKEIIENLDKDEFSYHPFDCKTGTYAAPISVKKKAITIIEGSYSTHPYFGDAYDFKIFCDIDTKMQKERLRAREGEEKLDRFVCEWIPMENAYFKAYDIKENCDVVV